MTFEPDPLADKAEAAPRPTPMSEQPAIEPGDSGDQPDPIEALSTSGLAAAPQMLDGTMNAPVAEAVASGPASDDRADGHGATKEPPESVVSDSVEVDEPPSATPPPQQRVESANGGVIVGDPSAMNRQPWWSDNRARLSGTGLDRDLDADLGRVGDLALLAISLRGVKHQYYAGANEDAFCISYTDDWLVIAVADGVSSARHSAYASKFISHSVCRSLRHLLAGTPAPSESTLHDFVERSVMSANEKVQHWTIDDLGAPEVDSDDLTEDERYDSLATTLSIALVPLSSNDDNVRTVQLATVGDSPTYTLHRGEWVLHTAATKEGEILDNSTQALPARAGVDIGLDWWTIDLLPDAALFVMTDGIGTSLGRGGGQVGEWLAAELGTPCTIDKAVRAARFDRRGEDDDRTLVAVWGPDLMQEPE